MIKSRKPGEKKSGTKIWGSGSRTNGVPMTRLATCRASLSNTSLLITLNLQRFGLEGRIDLSHMRAIAEQSPHGPFQLTESGYQRRHASLHRVTRDI